jgi:hypothetical protein
MGLFLFLVLDLTQQGPQWRVAIIKPAGSKVARCENFDVSMLISKPQIVRFSLVNIFPLVVDGFQ